MEVEIEIPSEQDSLEDVGLLEPETKELVEQYFQMDVSKYIQEFKHKLDTDGRFKYPGSMEKSQEYGNAIRTGQSKGNGSNYGKEEFSGFYAHNPYYNLHDHPDEFGSMGVGYATYFLWFKMLLFLVCIPFLLVCGYNLWTYYGNGSCYSSTERHNNEELLKKVVNSNYTLTSAELGNLRQGERDLFLRNSTRIGEYFKSICKGKIAIEDCHHLHEQNCSLDGKQPSSCEQSIMKMYLERYSSTVCKKSVFNTLSAGNTIGNHFKDKVVSPPILVVIVLALGLIMYCHAYHKSKDRLLNAEFLTLDDISLKFVGIPLDIENPYKALKDALTSMDSKYKPKRISLLFSTERLEKLIQALDKTQSSLVLNRFLQSSFPLNPKFGEKITELTAKKQKLIEWISSTFQDYNSGKSKYFLGQVFVSFESISVAQDAFRDFKHSFFRTFSGRHKLKIQNSNVTALRADHPLDIVWANLHVGFWQRFRRRLVGLFVSALVFVFNLIVFFYVHIFVDNFMEHHKTGFISTLLKYAVALVVFIAEELLEHLMGYLAEYQKPTTISKDSASKAQRIWLICFANSG